MAAARPRNAWIRGVEWCFYAASPALVGPMVMSVAFDNAVAVYAFVASFLFIAYSSLAQLVTVLVVEGVVQAAWRWLRAWVGWLWDWSVDTYRELRKNVVGRSVLSIAIAHLALFVAFFLYHNFDAAAMFAATRDFLASIPRYILDWHMLSAALHDWLNGFFSSGIVGAVRRVWALEERLMQTNPLAALALGAVVTALLVGIVVSILGMRSTWRSLLGDAPIPLAAPEREPRRSPSAGRKRRAGAEDVSSVDD